MEVVRDIGKEFRKELKELLTKYNADISFDYCQRSDSWNSDICEERILILTEDYVELASAQGLNLGVEDL